METPFNIVIIDDDETNNTLCSISIRHSLGKNAVLNTFTLPNDAISHIKDEYNIPDANLKTVLFLDINMPIVDGWDTLAMIEKLEDNIKKQLVVFMLSSSIDQNDKIRALEHPLVSDFVEKPLTAEKIDAIFK